MAHTYAVVHLAGAEAPDDGSIAPAASERRWVGSAPTPDAARLAWSAAHGRGFTGPVLPWTSDQLGMDNLLIFRVPASPFDIAGLVALIRHRGQPVGYVPALEHRVV